MHISKEGEKMNEDFIILPNPDFIKRKQIEEKIKNNDGYCISVLKPSEDNKCICKDFKEQQETGLCKCGQYYKILKLPKVCLCGDLCLKGTVLRVAHKIALEGYIVLSSILYLYKDNFNNLSEDEKRLLEIHKAEIAEADIVYIINFNPDVISELTQKEIEWATQLGKKIEYIDSEC